MVTTEYAVGLKMKNHNFLVLTNTVIINVPVFLSADYQTLTARNEAFILSYAVVQEKLSDHINSILSKTADTP